MWHEPEGLRRLLALAAFLVLTISALGAFCKRTPVETAANSNAQGEAGEVATTPPFPTREPERYQWRRVITGTVMADKAAPGPPGITQEVFMARDGEKRREDYEVLKGVKLTVLRLPEGSYTLYPAKKIYAELGAAGSPQSNTSAPQDFSTGKLVNAARAGARYEKLGTEEVGGRMTTKYRVTPRAAEAGQPAETIVWVDESLGMPIKSESISRSEATGESKYTVEYMDIKLEADASLFVLPRDYRKVSQEEIQRETLANLPGLLGADGEEEKEQGKKR